MSFVYKYFILILSISILSVFYKSNIILFSLTKYQLSILKLAWRKKSYGKTFCVFKLNLSTIKLMQSILTCTLPFVELVHGQLNSDNVMQFYPNGCINITFQERRCSLNLLINGFQRLTQCAEKELLNRNL